MRFVEVILGGLVTRALAQRPENTSICDYYTASLLKENSAENQYTVLTLLVNTVVIGNYTQPNVGIAVPGILQPGMHNGEMVNLMPFFNGDLESANQGGSSGVSVNFLDGGGAEPLQKNKPANDTSSNQYKLLTHLYSFFGSLLGCSMYGQTAFPAYAGRASMYEVHAFMDLKPAQLGYFIEQVALAGASFGVAQSDLHAVGDALNSLFGMRCAPPTSAIKEQGPQLQAICVESSCPLAKDAVCDAYKIAAKLPANHTDAGGMNMTMPGSMNGSMTMSMPAGTATTTTNPSTMKNAAAVLGSTLLLWLNGILVLFL